MSGFIFRVTWRFPEARPKVSWRRFVHPRANGAPFIWPHSNVNAVLNSLLNPKRIVPNLKTFLLNYTIWGPVQHHQCITCLAFLHPFQATVPKVKRPNLNAWSDLTFYIGMHLLPFQLRSAYCNCDCPPPFAAAICQAPLDRCCSNRDAKVSSNILPTALTLFTAFALLIVPLSTTDRASLWSA